MFSNKFKILIATSDEAWQRHCIEQIPSKHSEIERVDSGERVLQLLRTRLSDIIIMDDSLADLSPLEFALNVRDLVRNAPFVLIGGAGLAPFEHVWSRCGVFFAGNKETVPPMIHEALLELHLRRERLSRPATRQANATKTRRTALLRKQADTVEEVPVHN